MQLQAKEMVIWDIFVRVFHWSVATLFLLDFWVLEEGDPPHEWAGYALGILLILRILWGFIGPHNARFTSFFPTPARVMKHLSELRHHQINRREGHNPLGGAMVIALMAMLAIVAMSGWMLNWDIFWGEDWVEELHEISAEITMILVFIHVTAVIIMGKFTNIRHPSYPPKVVYTFYKDTLNPRHTQCCPESEHIPVITRWSAV